jgi:hypothetical protein
MLKKKWFHGMNRIRRAFGAAVYQVSPNPDFRSASQGTPQSLKHLPTAPENGAIWVASLG